MVVGNFSNGSGTCCTNLHLISLRHATSRIFSCRHVWVLQIAKAKYRETIPEDCFFNSMRVYVLFTHIARSIIKKKIYISFKNLYKYLIFNISLLLSDVRFKQCKQVKKCSLRVDLRERTYILISFLYLCNVKSRDKNIFIFISDAKRNSREKKLIATERERVLGNSQILLTDITASFPAPITSTGWYIFFSHTFSK